MNAYLIPIEVTATTDDPQLLASIIENVLAEGLAQYHQLGDLDAFERLTVFVSPVIDLDDAMLEQRAKREARLRGFWKFLEWVQPTRQEERAEQLAMPGL